MVVEKLFVTFTEGNFMNFPCFVFYDRTEEMAATCVHSYFSLEKRFIMKV